MSANVIRDNKQAGANLWGIMGHTLSDMKLGHQEDPKGPLNNGERLISGLYNVLYLLFSVTGTLCCKILCHMG